MATAPGTRSEAIDDEIADLLKKSGMTNGLCSGLDQKKLENL